MCKWVGLCPEEENRAINKYAYRWSTCCSEITPFCHTVKSCKDTVIVNVRHWDSERDITKNNVYLIYNP